MAWNTKAKNTNIEDLVETIYVNLKLPKNDFNKENIKFMIGGVADKGIYQYASTMALTQIKSIAPDWITDKGIKLPGNPNTESKIALKRTLTIEHSVPNIYVCNYLYNLENDDINQALLMKIFDVLKCVIITVDEDNLLNKKYKTSMPNGWCFDNNVFARYKECGIKINNVLTDK